MRLFVYGTLRSGTRAHRRYCPNAIDSRPATVRGRLYQLSAGYPALELPPGNVLAVGTVDPLADARVQSEWNQSGVAHAMTALEGDWDAVAGEVFSLPDPLRDLPPVDAFEEFLPGGPSLYERVLVWVEMGADRECAWLYRKAGPIEGRRLESGRWFPGAWRDRR